MLRRPDSVYGTCGGGSGDGGRGSVNGTGGAASPARWEGVGGEVMTLVIPTKLEDFAPEASPGGRQS